LLIENPGQQFTIVHRTEEVIDYGGPAWMGLVGLSRNGKRFAVDVGWSAGDYDHHRPTVLTIADHLIVSRSLDDQIFDQLPSCDYSQLFTGITNAGEAIIHVPKSIYVDEGCPDQGEWLFNLQTGKVRRVKAK
jgi:hypothetical protein